MELHRPGRHLLSAACLTLAVVLASSGCARFDNAQSEPFTPEPKRGGGMTTTTVPVAGFEDVDGSGNVLLWDKARASQFFDALANDQQIPQDLITTG